MRRMFLAITLVPCLLFAQVDKKPDVWQPLKFFVGSWEGTGKGQSGISKVEREYQFVLNGRFLQVKNKSIDGKTLVFMTESIENIPTGWRAKETYTILNEDEFVEIFELAEPGKSFKVYTENHLKREK